MKQKFSLFVVLSLMASCWLFSCKSKIGDDDVLKAVNQKLAARTDLKEPSATVAEGIVTLAGNINNETSKNDVAVDVKSVEGVKDVVNNITIVQPAAPVTILPDDALIQSVNGALSNYSGVSAHVSDGIVTLQGNIKRADLQKLMMTMNGLHPKKINNELTIK